MGDSVIAMVTIGDEPFKISYMEYDIDRYEEFLLTKIDVVRSKLPKLFTSQINNVEIVRSPIKHFRQRCRFAIATSIGTTSNGDSDLDPKLPISSRSTNFKSDEEIVIDSKSRLRISPTTIIENNETTLSYSLWESGGPNIAVSSFPIASIAIYNAMPILLKYIQSKKELYSDLRAINFLSTLSGELIASLVYERQIDLNWEEEAITMQKNLGAHDSNLISLGHLIWVPPSSNCFLYHCAILYSILPYCISPLSFFLSLFLCLSLRLPQSLYLFLILSLSFTLLSGVSLIPSLP